MAPIPLFGHAGSSGPQYTLLWYMFPSPPHSRIHVSFHPLKDADIFKLSGHPDPEAGKKHLPQVHGWKPADVSEVPDINPASRISHLIWT